MKSKLYFQVNQIRKKILIKQNKSKHKHTNTQTQTQTNINSSVSQLKYFEKILTSNPVDLEALNLFLSLFVDEYDEKKKLNRQTPKQSEFANKKMLQLLFSNRNSINNEIFIRSIHIFAKNDSK